MAPARGSSATSRPRRCSTRSACFDPPGAPTANAAGFPFAGLSISGSVVTVRDVAKPSVIARGPLVAPGWRVDDQPLRFGATDPVGIRQLRVLVDGARRRPSDRRATTPGWPPAGSWPSARPRLGTFLLDGRHTVGVEATDTAGNVTRVDRAVAVDRNGPALSFVPSGAVAGSRSTRPTWAGRHGRDDRGARPPARSARCGAAPRGRLVAASRAARAPA